MLSIIYIIKITKHTLIWIFKFFYKFFYIIFIPISKILKPLALKAYHLIIKIKILKNKPQNDNNILQIAEKEKSNKKIIPYILFIFISIATITNNIFAKIPESEEFAKNTIIGKIISSQNENFFYDDITVEEGPAVITQNNMNSGSAIEAPLPTLQTIEDNTVCTNIITTEEGSALLATHLSDESLKEQPRDKVIAYTVEQGDTISAIAQKLGINVATILWSNDLTYYSTIKPGKTLKIPPTTGLIHTVIKGENLSSIAKKYSSDAEKILAINKLSTSDQISIGLELIIPDGIKPADKIVATNITKSKNIIIPEKANVVNTGTKLLWPTAASRITQYYSWRHTGLDIGGKSGTAIYAAESGTVEVSGYNTGGYGYYIIINHGNGIKTLYAHSSKLLVSRGEKVSRGQTIMLMGSTGRSTGPHLHFEVRVGGYKKNPLSYIR